MHITSSEKEVIPDEIFEEAKELVRGAEVLPDGVKGLASKIYEARKQNRVLRVKLGVDPTSCDLHLGHAVVFRKLRRFQEFGHQIVLIIGGFTAQIGDPSGRDKTRPSLTKEAVAANAETYKKQMGLILDLTKTEVVNNADWLGPLDLNEILRLASFSTVNQMLAKEAFGERMDKQLPIAMHELFYPLLQAYDSVAIKADIELGGTDQRFNILQGRELQPKYGLSPQLGMFLPLLEGTCGEKKMSKSYDNYIALKDLPKDMFGKCMRIPDSLIIKYFELCTTFVGSEIDAIAESLKDGANPKDMKEKLGYQIVSQYHGKDAAENALSEWQKVHSEKQLPYDMPVHIIKEEKMLFKLLMELGMAGSGGEAKRLITEGAVRIDGEFCRDANKLLMPQSDSGIVIQVGRRKFAKLVMD